MKSRRSGALQPGKLGLSCNANKRSDVGTGYLSVLTTQETSSMKIQLVMPAQPVPGVCRLKQTIITSFGSLTSGARMLYPKNVKSLRLFGPTEGVGNGTQESMTRNRPLDCESGRTVEPGVPLSETWSAPLVMPAQPAPSECHHK